ncbi:MAG TPA: hypothetical protein VNT55_08125 [Baekduia sp.]|nr:hypothetical protein [Baekduia sp.]
MFRSSVAPVRLLAVGAIVLAGIVPASASAADPPPVRYVDGAIHVTGTAGDDGYVIGAGGSATTVAITATTHGFGTSEDDAGVCSTITEHATCELDARTDGRTGPAEVVFDLGGGADSVELSPTATGVAGVTASYAGATSGLTYVGGSPAHVTIAGATGALTGVGRIVGTPFADTFTGGPAAEVLAGGDGDDTFDVAAGGGPADTVDCGAGRDTVALRAGVDRQTACEVVNGVDTTAPSPVPTPAPPSLPNLPTFLPPAVHVPSPSQVPGKNIDLTVTCKGACPGDVMTFQPPPMVAGGGSGLPPSWPVLNDAAKLDELLAILAALAKQTSIAALQRELSAARAAYLARVNELRRQGQNALDDARLAADRALLEAITSMVQAAIAMGATTQSQSGKLQDQINKKPTVKTPLTNTTKNPTGKASASATRRPTGRAFARWLLLRTARALPTLRAKLTPTAQPGTYRARLTAPTWLRGTGRILRHAGVKTLPVDLVIGSTKTRVHLPLPR